MDQYRKLIIIFCFLLSINSFAQTQIISDSVFCYLTTANKQNISFAFPMKFFVHNASNDSIFIEHFNKYIAHSPEYYYRKIPKSILYWDLRTLSNQEPEIMAIVLSASPAETSRKLKKIEKKIEKNIRIVIPPKNTFVSDVYMLYSRFIVYPKGYYKLYLFDKTTDKCIAETIIEIK